MSSEKSGKIFKTKLAKGVKMETSQELQQLAEALAKAQAELSPVQFDSYN